MMNTIPLQLIIPRLRSKQVTPGLFAFVMCAVANTATYAQALVQQPVVGVNSVSTTVSVPDRGEMYLGGVKQARESRNSTGLLRPGTNTGLERSASSMSARVYIHNFAEMDAALLNQGRMLAQSSNSQSTVSLVKKHLADKQIANPEQTIYAEKTSASSNAEKFQFYIEKSIAAEKSGKLQLAKLHRTMAQKYANVKSATGY